MRVVALLASYNEERFIGGCIEHLVDQGADVYLIDNESTDNTVEIAERYAGRGLIGIETFPRNGVYRWRPLLERKAALAESLDADWFLHVDADEIRLPPRSSSTLGQALAEVDRLGFNAVNFQEYTFVPTRESPNHDHPDFQRTMRWYYPFRPWFPHQLKAWKRQPGPIDLASSGGHRVDFDGLRIYPQSFRMRHYLFLSVDHAIRKYVRRTYDEQELESGWHGGRARLEATDVELLPASTLRRYHTDDELDDSGVLTHHPLLARLEVDT
jgi:glycosyltransferase involved in cell wall biosynthesis